MPQFLILKLKTVVSYCLGKAPVTLPFAQAGDEQQRGYTKRSTSSRYVNQDNQPYALITDRSMFVVYLDVAIAGVHCSFRIDNWSQGNNSKIDKHNFKVLAYNERPVQTVNDVPSETMNICFRHVFQGYGKVYFQPVVPVFLSLCKLFETETCFKKSS